MNDRRPGAGNGAREQNPAYVLLRPFYFYSTVHPDPEMEKRESDLVLWQSGLAGLKREVAALEATERMWMSAQLERIALVQQELHALFQSGEGETQCRDCLGACCAHGKHHLTLANLLACLLAGEEPPDADFSAPCPMLGPQGCRIEVARRPFNCVTFACEPVEKAMGAQNAALFYEREKQLRHIYETFARRYAAGSLRGLLIALERLGERPLLDPP